MSATCDWNILLDENGGPFHNRRTPCNAIVHYNTKTEELEIMPQYFAIKHFSGFVKKGAVRLGTSSYFGAISISAFKNPDESIVAVITNNSQTEQESVLRLDDYAAPITLKPESITTVLIEK